MNIMPDDPTAFRPMKVTASKDTEIGFELESITNKITLDKTRIYQQWPMPGSKHLHTDYMAAQKFGLRKPIVQGNQVSGHILEMLIKFFGEGFFGGDFSVTCIKIIEVDDEIITKGVVREKVTEGDFIRLKLDVWCENQHGEKVIVGTASGLVR
jgi:acyl dehydratase